MPRVKLYPNDGGKAGQYFACDRCHAKPFEPCKTVTGRRAGTVMKVNHRQRVNASQWFRVMIAGLMNEAGVLDPVPYIYGDKALAMRQP